MANKILAERNAPVVGKNWAFNFVNRRPELETRFSRRYDYKRAQCEDPDAINSWFRLVAKMVANYGVADSDIYNFDETVPRWALSPTGWSLQARKDVPT